MSREIPQRILPDVVAERIGERHLSAAVFVTYQLEPGFFEDAVLGALFDCATGRGDRVQRALLEDRLRESEVLVFYDRAGLCLDRTPRQAVSLVPVSWKSHLLHAKHALLLVETEREEMDGTGSRVVQEPSLILLTTSANLTRTGWWENVEVADIVELSHREATPLAPDLQRLVTILRGLDPHGEHDALDRVATFVEALVPSHGLPRLWTGDEPLPQFLAKQLDEVEVARIESFAPFVSEDAGPLHALDDRLRPRELLVRMPVDRDGAPAASAIWRDAVARLDGARFAELPGDVDRSLGSGASGERFVHAKVLRVVATDGRAWVLAGSPNLTAAGFAGRETGNLETAILHAVRPEPPWLTPLSEKPPAADQTREAPEAKPWSLLRIRLRYDWKRGEASYLLDGSRAVEVAIGRFQGTQVVLALTAEPGDVWRPLPDDFAAWLRTELATSNVLDVRAGDDDPMPLLVEEVERLDRPDFLHQALTPADILRYWSIRDPAAREAHLADLVERASSPGADVAVEMRERRSMFDNFAGLFHGFLCFRERLRELLRKGRSQAVVTRLLGRGHDALPTLLEKVLEDDRGDPVMRLLALLSAQEVVDEMQEMHPELLSAHPERLASLTAMLQRLDDAWEALGLEGGDIEPAAFRDWYTQAWSARPAGEGA